MALLHAAYATVLANNCLAAEAFGGRTAENSSNREGRVNFLARWKRPRGPPQWQEPQLSARLRDDADVGFRLLPARRPDLLGVVVRDRARDDDLVALLPVHRRRHLVLGGE